eukprot:6890642-Pyramimonas_sp.AAC.1
MVCASQACEGHSTSIHSTFLHFPRLRLSRSPPTRFKGGAVARGALLETGVPGVSQERAYEGHQE